MSIPSGNGREPNSDRRPESAQSRESGVDGLTCPMCGSVADSLDVKVRRRVDGFEERFNVCSLECADQAQSSPFVQMSLFGGDTGVWSRSIQAELDLNETQSPDDSRQ